MDEDNKSDCSTTDKNKNNNTIQESSTDSDKVKEVNGSEVFKVKVKNTTPPQTQKDDDKADAADGGQMSTSSKSSSPKVKQEGQQEVDGNNKDDEEKIVDVVDCIVDNDDDDKATKPNSNSDSHDDSRNNGATRTNANGTIVAGRSVPTVEFKQKSEIPGPHDVLLGRGSGTNNHSGNVKFRELVNEYKIRYIASPKVEKPKVAREVVAIWRKLTPPGRFLARRDEKKGPGSVNNPENVWYEVGDDKAREKASQCLRERKQVAPHMLQELERELHEREMRAQHFGGPQQVVKIDDSNDDQDDQDTEDEDIAQTAGANALRANMLVNGNPFLAGKMMYKRNTATARVLSGISQFNPGGAQQMPPGTSAGAGAPGAAGAAIDPALALARMAGRGGPDAATAIANLPPEILAAAGRGQPIPPMMLQLMDPTGSGRLSNEGGGSNLNGNNNNDNNNSNKMNAANDNNNGSNNMLQRMAAMQQATHSGQESPSTIMAQMQKHLEARKRKEETETLETMKAMRQQASSLSQAAVAKDQEVSNEGMATGSESLEENWEELFQRLLYFREENGHCAVPLKFEKDPQLGYWVSKQRVLFQNLVSGKQAQQTCTLTPARISKLSQIGFEWSRKISPNDIKSPDPESNKDSKKGVANNNIGESISNKSDEDGSTNDHNSMSTHAQQSTGARNGGEKYHKWEIQFKNLLIYAANHGHSIVPRSKAGEKDDMFAWLATQREQYERLMNGEATTLTHERIKLLNAMGFPWMLPEHRVMETLRLWTSEAKSYERRIVRNTAQILLGKLQMLMGLVDAEQEAAASERSMNNRMQQSNPFSAAAAAQAAALQSGQSNPFSAAASAAQAAAFQQACQSPFPPMSSGHSSHSSKRKKDAFKKKKRKRKKKPAQDQTALILEGITARAKAAMMDRQMNEEAAVDSSDSSVDNSPKKKKKKKRKKTNGPMSPAHSDSESSNDSDGDEGRDRQDQTSSILEGLSSAARRAEMINNEGAAPTPSDAAALMAGNNPLLAAAAASGRGNGPPIGLPPLGMMNPFSQQAAAMAQLQQQMPFAAPHPFMNAMAGAPGHAAHLQAAAMAGMDPSLFAAKMMQQQSALRGNGGGVPPPGSAGAMNAAAAAAVAAAFGGGGGRPTASNSDQDSDRESDSGQGSD